MGLKMYLTGNKYLFAGLKDPSQNVFEDGYRVRGRDLELGYWEEHYALHHFMVTTFADGVNDGKPIELDAEDISNIMDAIENGDVPSTEEGFSGVSIVVSDEEKETLSVLREALIWLETSDDLHWRNLTYVASW